jgi:succinate-semialdehyde dehydrogenase/glutarate-semialdehyde dehydrogenase
MTINTSASTTSGFAVSNPATGEIIQHVPNMGVKEVELVIQKAAHALPTWRSKTGKERAALLRNWFDLIKAHADELAHLMTSEQGKPIKEAMGEVLYAASFIEWFAEEAKRVTGAIPSSTWSDKRMLVLKQPIGVCAAITPWNFPLAMITRKAGPALAAGCTIIIKPAEQTPLSALALADLAKKAGIPDCVINVVTCDSANSIEVGKLICDSPVVRHLSFTGSTAVGKILMAQCAPTVKKIALELGGHAPFIVFEDADIDAAVEGAIQSKYRNSGQTCVCSNRFYVHKNLYEQFVEKMALASKNLVVGNGLTEGVLQGPLIDEAAVLKVESHIQDAVKKGARIVVGGKRHTQGGNFFEPTVLADVNESMLVMHEETFGPVAAIKSFSSEEEVIAAANNSEFGLASYFYSKDISRIFRVAEAMEFGMVGVNTGIISNEVAPFGGVKQSGLGREGSSWGMDEYLEMKYICLGL